MASKALGILAAFAVTAGVCSTAAAQPKPQKIRIGLFAPSVEFGTAEARLAYVQGLAKAIEQATGVRAEAQPYASLSAMRADNVDYAIVDGPCYATNLGWRLLASANIGGGVTRPWALFSSAGDTMQSLRGKKLAYVATGCNDAGFVDNAMLESEVDPGFFGSRVGEKDLTGAIADVASYKTAQAVFAPVASVKGLTKVFDTGAVPNPAFVEISGKLPADKVAAAVIGYGGGGAITGWTRPSREAYQALAARLARVVKQGLLATPEPVRLDAREALVDPATLRDPAAVPVRSHYIKPAGDRMQ